MEAPITQATARGNTVVAVFEDRVEILSGWQGQNVETVGLKDVSEVRVRGVVNCSLTIQSNKGQLFRLEDMALPDARAVRAAVERQKQKAGLYE